MHSPYFRSSAAHYPHGIVFHYFQGAGHPSQQGAITQEELRRTLLFLGKENILPAEEWKRRAIRGALRGHDLCITFDDGLKSQKDIAVPVLEELGITAFFFLYTAPFEGHLVKLEVYRFVRNTCFSTVDAFYAHFDDMVAVSPYARECAQALRSFDVSAYLREYSFHTDADRKFRFLRDAVLGQERYELLMDRIVDEYVRKGMIDREQLRSTIWMSPEDVRALRGKGHVIGLHSHTHPTQMAALSPADQEKEYRQNFTCLSQLLGEPVTTMSHPCSSYTEHSLRILADLGITLGFRADMGASGGPLEFPRQDNANVLRMMHEFAKLRDASAVRT